MTKFVSCLSFFSFLLIVTSLILFYIYYTNHKRNEDFSKADCKITNIKIQEMNCGTRLICYLGIIFVDYEIDGEKINSSLVLYQKSKIEEVNIIFKKYSINSNMSCYYYKYYPTYFILKLLDEKNIFIAAIIILSLSIIFLILVLFILLFTKFSKNYKIIKKFSLFSPN
ncbi:Hypothetical protein KVN_LOCUS543 [uncultured virus]|nr:Hypothetical protein KVN_LOCUS543 [uncultured virus]